MKRRAIYLATRRQFLSSAAAMAVLTLGPRGIAEQTTDGVDGGIEAKLAGDPMRPQFHLLPAKNWMNDPNGPVYVNGRYHMFFQYNPQAATWGDMSWNHAVSPDMIHWSHLPLALTPTPDSADAYGCFSGSAIRVESRVYQVYTGTRLAPSKELATIRDGEDKIQESQCLAYSEDAELIKWTKLPQPIVALPPEGMKITGFRDPSAWKQGEWYYMTVGAGEAKVGGCVLLYRTSNLEDAKSWKYLHKLAAGEWNGKPTSNPCDDGEMWECPDFFALDGRHVLIYSTLGKVFWQSGRLDVATMIFHPEKTGELDLGGFYAPKTQLDAHGRRILWGWLQEKRSEDAMRAAGWSGMMGLPRLMHLDADGTLQVTMLPELVRLRAGSIPAAPDASRLIVRAASGEILCSGKPGHACSLTMTTEAGELLRAIYSPENHQVTVDGKPIVLKPGDTPSFHAFVDASVIELIVSGRIGYTKRFYYSGPTAPEVSVVASGDHVLLSGWKVKPISSNRLTTPAPAAAV